MTSPATTCATGRGRCDRGRDCRAMRVELEGSGFDRFTVRSDPPEFVSLARRSGREPADEQHGLALDWTFGNHGARVRHGAKWREMDDPRVGRERRADRLAVHFQLLAQRSHLVVCVEQRHHVRGLVMRSPARPASRSRRSARDARLPGSCRQKRRAPARTPAPERSILAIPATLPAAGSPALRWFRGCPFIALFQYMFKRCQIHNQPKLRRPRRAGRPTAMRSTLILFRRSDSPCSNLLKPQAGERILDLGCGDGVLD